MRTKTPVFDVFYNGFWELYESACSASAFDWLQNVQVLISWATKSLQRLNDKTWITHSYVRMHAVPMQCLCGDPDAIFPRVVKPQHFYLCFLLSI